MRGILKFFVSWLLFIGISYLLASMAQGTFDTSFWTKAVREGVTMVGGLGGFCLSILTMIITEE